MDSSNCADKTAFAVKHRSESVRMASRSGGVFTALSDVILNQGGIVYGVRLDEDLEAVHARADTKEIRDTFRGSKYVQSRIGSAYADCEEDLRDGKTVLFSGTPCQIDGLKNYLKAKGAPTERLITIEILCHGVPSPRVVRDYIEYVGKGEKVSSVEFRDKVKFGWKDHAETLRIGEKEVSSRQLAVLFLGHNTTRSSCFHCPYKRVERYADITIGDFWGIEELDKKFDDNKGVSLLLLHSEMGKHLFEQAVSDLDVEEFPLSNSMQPVLCENYKEPGSRAQFWKDYETMPFSGIVRKYGVDRVQAAKRMVKKLLGRV